MHRIAKRANNLAEATLLISRRETILFFPGLLGWRLSAVAQQTIFNVPSFEITPKNRLLAQQQVDISKEELRSTTTLDIGPGRNW